MHTSGELAVWPLRFRSPALMDKVLSYLSDTTWTMLPSRKPSLINFSRPAKRSPNVLIPALDDTFCTQAMWSIKTAVWVVAPADVANALFSAKDIGGEALEEHVRTRLNSYSIPLTNIIKKQKLLTFSSIAKTGIKHNDTAKAKSQSLQSDYKLFSRLTVISKDRHVDLEKLFAYEQFPM